MSRQTSALPPYIRTCQPCRSLLFTRPCAYSPQRAHLTRQKCKSSARTLHTGNPDPPFKAIYKPRLAKEPTPDEPYYTPLGSPLPRQTPGSESAPSIDFPPSALDLACNGPPPHSCPSCARTFPTPFRLLFHHHFAHTPQSGTTIQSLTRRDFAYRNDPIDQFFRLYESLHSFKYLPTLPSHYSFGALARHMRWPQNQRTYGRLVDHECQVAHDAFREAVVETFNTMFGERPDMEGWRRVCIAAGVSPDGTRVERQQRFEAIFVNPVDLLDDARSVPRRPTRQFSGEAELERYTVKERRRFPRIPGKWGKLLRDVMAVRPEVSGMGQQQGEQQKWVDWRPVNLESKDLEQESKDLEQESNRLEQESNRLEQEGKLKITRFSSKKGWSAPKHEAVVTENVEIPASLTRAVRALKISKHAALTRGVSAEQARNPWATVTDTKIETLPLDADPDSAYTSIAPSQLTATTASDTESSPPRIARISRGMQRGEAPKAFRSLPIKPLPFDPSDTPAEPPVNPETLAEAEAEWTEATYPGSRALRLPKIPFTEPFPSIPVPIIPSATPYKASRSIPIHKPLDRAIRADPAIISGKSAAYGEVDKYPAFRSLPIKSLPFTPSPPPEKPSFTILRVPRTPEWALEDMVAGNYTQYKSVGVEYKPFAKAEPKKGLQTISRYPGMPGKKVVKGIDRDEGGEGWGEVLERARRVLERGGRE